ncbi:MAG: cbb3-type cytochrome c oxidase subunit I [Verrucomicrobiia bacterium]
MKPPVKTIKEAAKKWRQEEISPEEIYYSCRWFITFLIFKSAGWMLIVAVVKGLALIQLIFPEIAAATAALSYGRLSAAASTILIYGFALQGLLAVAFYSSAVFGKTKIQHSLLIYGALILWNIGVLTGAIGALLGDTTGYEWFELPRYTGMILSVAAALFAVGLTTILATRAEETIHPSIWFWTILVYSIFLTIVTSQLFFVALPVSGVSQLLIHIWLKNILFNICLCGGVIGAVFYALSELKFNLYSRRIALVAFFSLMIAGGYGNISPSMPLPKWVYEMNSSASLLMIIPLLAALLNTGLTLFYKKKSAENKSIPYPLHYFSTALISAAFFVICAVSMFSINISRIIEFSIFSTGQDFLLICAVLFVFIGFSEIALPMLHNKSEPRGSSVQMWLIIGGGFTLAVSFLTGGFIQGANFYDYREKFIDAINSIKPFIFTGSLAIVIIISGLLLFFYRSGKIVFQSIIIKINELRELNMGEEKDEKMI